MPKRPYKFMVLDHLDHLSEVKRENLDADAEACEYARRLFSELDCKKIEVWHGPRLICLADKKGIHVLD